MPAHEARSTPCAPEDDEGRQEFSMRELLAAGAAANAVCTPPGESEDPDATGDRNTRRDAGSRPGAR